MALFAEVCGGDHARLREALAGVRAYQAHPYRRSLPPMPAVAVCGEVALRDYGGSGPPVVIVPSLINPASVLDLAPGMSLLRWLATQGVHPLLVDWGDLSGLPDGGLDAVIAARLVPLLAQFGRPVTLVGYCLGGTMALAAAQHAGVTRLALLATPWHFDGYEPAQRQAIIDHAAQVMPVGDQLGLVPMDLLQPAFWSLDKAGVVDKFVRFAALDAASPAAQAFVALEDWVNDGAPLPLAAARDLFGDLFEQDRSGRGEWRIGGRRVDPGALGIPILNIVASGDRIVPAATALRLGARRDVPLGHVGMIVSSRARALMWEPLAQWLREG